MAKDTAEVMGIVLLCLTVAVVVLGVSFKVQDHQNELQWKNMSNANMRELAGIQEGLAVSLINVAAYLEEQDKTILLLDDRVDELGKEVAMMPRYEQEGKCMVVRTPNATEYEMQCQTT